MMMESGLFALDGVRSLSDIDLIPCVWSRVKAAFSASRGWWYTLGDWLERGEWIATVTHGLRLSRRQSTQQLERRAFSLGRDVAESG